MLFALAAPWVIGCVRDSPDSNWPVSDERFITGADMAQPVEAYQRNDGLTRDRLLLSADGVYRRTWSGCGGGVSQEGRFTRQENWLLFDTPDSEEGDESAGERLPTRLIDIRWGERSYLLHDSEEHWIGFCNAVNSGAEPVMGRINRGCLMRDGDENRAATGRPILPEPWAEYLLPSPLAGQTTGVAGDGSTWVNLGADHGLREGMELYMLRQPTEPELQHLWASEPLRILEVTSQSSRLRTWVHRGTTLPVGLEVTSRAPVELAAR
ncbi:MAG TPA: hypothetical protein VFD43_11440 [Planctomycetota bacterium]|nr:hypothetical protein [Planctomycetota bacterium]